MKNLWLIIRMLARETIKEWREDNAASVAAALAYYAIFSLSPLLIVLALVLGLVIGSNSAQDQLLGGLQSTFGDQGSDTLGRTFDQATEPTAGNIISGVIWFGVVIWGVTGLFAQLQKALNIIWEVRLMPGVSPLIFLKNRLLSFIVVMIACLLFIASTLINASLSQVETDSTALLLLMRPSQFFVTLFLITFLFAAIFRILPDVIIEWRDVWVGAMFTGVLFIFGQFVVGFYIANSNIGSVYGAAGSLTVILVWIYYSAQILLLGAEFTEVWARFKGAMIRPDADAVWVDPVKAEREKTATQDFMQKIS